MPTTSVRDIELIEVGSLGKETLANDAFESLAIGISGTLTIPLTGDRTLTAAESLHFVLILTGALTAHVNVTMPADPRVYIVDNRTTGAYNVTLFPSAGGGVAAVQGERTLVYCDGANVYPVASGTGGGGGGGAPTDATYLVGNAHALLSAERVVTSTGTIGWDLTVPGQAQAYIPDDAVTLTKMQPIATQKLLGRFSAGTGDIQLIDPGTGLVLDASGALNVVSTGGQPLDATLTALAALATGADQLPYFTGTDTAAQTPLTAMARTLLDDADAAAMRTTLALVPGTHVQTQDATLTALAGLTTGANQMIFFTGTDTASTTPLTAFARALLDDFDAAAMRSTLGITEGGSTSIPFTALLDVPSSYVGQGGKTVAVKADQSGLEFIPGASGFQPLDATLSALAGLTTAADTVPLFTGVDVATLLTVTPYARTLLDDATATEARATLGLVPGTDVQAQDATLTALAGVTTGVDLLPYFVGLDLAQTTTLTSFMRTLLDDPDAATARATLGIPAGLSSEDVQDIVGAMATDSATLDFAYDDTAGTFTGSVKDASLTEAKLTLADVTTLNVSTTAHGLVPKAPNVPTEFLNGTGGWSTPAGGESAWTRVAGAAGSTAATGLLAFWRLEEASGNRVDSVASQALVPTGAPGSAAGKTGQAVSFDTGSGKYLAAADSATLSVGTNQDFTVACWVRFNGTPAGSRGLVGKGNASIAYSNCEYLLGTSGTALLWYVGNGASSVNVNAGVTLVAGTWYLVIGWYDAAADLQYVQVNNGTPSQVANANGSFDSTGPVEVGRQPQWTGSTPLDGLIDNVMFWKRVLTAGERADLWNGGAGVDYADLLAAPSYLHPTTTTDYVLAGAATLTAAEPLESAGGLKLGTSTSTVDGVLRWTGTDLEVRKDNAWVSLTHANEASRFLLLGV